MQATAAIALAAGLVLVGCSKSDEDGEAPTSSTREVPADATQAASPDGKPTPDRTSARDATGGGARGILPPAKVLERGGESVKLVTRGDCEPKTNFKLFTGGPARRVKYTNALGTAEAVLACDEKGTAIRLDLHPEGAEDLRYRLFLVEAGLQVQAKQEGAWTKLCTGPRCASDKLASTDAETWTQGWKEAGGC